MRVFSLLDVDLMRCRYDMQTFVGHRCCIVWHQLSLGLLIRFFSLLFSQNSSSETHHKSTTTITNHKMKRRSTVVLYYYIILLSGIVSKNYTVFNTSNCLLARTNSVASDIYSRREWSPIPKGCDLQGMQGCS